MTTGSGYSRRVENTPVARGTLLDVPEGLEVIESLGIELSLIRLRARLESGGCRHGLPAFERLEHALYCLGLGGGSIEEFTPRSHSPRLVQTGKADEHLCSS